MAKMKVDEIDVEGWDDQEVKEGGNFQKYTGDIPKTGTMLLFRVTKAWLTYTEKKADGSGDDPMLKVLCVAEDGPGKLEEYDGLPAWENLALTPSSKWKTEPFLDHFGLTIRDVQSKLQVEDEDDNLGIPIQKIARWQPGSDDALFVGVVSKEKFAGNWQAHISEWLDADMPLDDEDEPEEKPAARRSRSAANGGRKKPAAATGRGRRAKDEPDDEEADEEEEARPTGRARGSRGTAKSRAAKPATRRGSRKSADDEGDDEPPF